MNPLTLAENRIDAVHLLAVSRESAVLRSLASVAENNGWRVETASSGWDAMERLQSGGAPQLLLLDLPRGDHDNLRMLRWLRRLRPDLAVIALCYEEDTEIGKEATRLGVEEILVRPLDDRQFESAIRRHLGAAGDLESEMMSQNVEQLGQGAFFVSASPVMQKLRAQAELLAQADVPVFILGEAGSGKDAVARLIHKLSVRSGFKFLKLNCAAMPGDLLESELFGSEQGFSGNAVPSSREKFEPAGKGTIFLDEVAEMPGRLQVRLLQALQNSELHRTGDGSAPPTVARILAATSTDLERALAGKKLREDLYYRLSAFTVRVPPLRQRKEEIAILLRYSMHQMAKHYGLPAREFSSAMLGACQRYDWPGNLSQLEAFVKRYLVSGDQEWTPGEMEAESLGNPMTGVASRPFRISPDLRWPHNSDETQVAPQSLKSFIQGIKCEAEKNAIAAALEKTGWNRKAAARLLRVSYRTLLYKIEQYQMTASLPSFPAPSIARFEVQGNETKGNGR